MEKYIKIYQKRVESLIRLFDKKDADWMSKRKWIEAMLEFELGENFFLKFFVEDDDAITDFQNIVITKWADKRIEKKVCDDDNEDEVLETTSSVLSETFLLGTEIEPEFEYDKTQQQKYLDFVWWVKIRDLLSSPSRMQEVSEQDKIELKYKKKLLYESLSV